ncbi:MAG: LysM peptidoglycan-binding domain-containing protein [Candidatus Nanopelagicales bacterium]
MTDRHTATPHHTPTAATPSRASAADANPTDEDDDQRGDYTVVRGDTLWEVADEQLDDPTRYPEIVQASEDITQPDGRHLTDPDLILPGWTLNVPDQTTEPAQTEAQSDEPTAEAGATEVPQEAEDSPTPGEQVVPPRTPLSAPAPKASGPSGVSPALAAAEDTPLAGPAVPGTPMRGGGEPAADAPVVAGAREAVYDDEGRFAPSHGVLGLPEWITYPLIPTRPEDAPELIAEAQAILARHSAKLAAARDAANVPPTPPGKDT